MKNERRLIQSPSVLFAKEKDGYVKLTPISLGAERANIWKPATVGLQAYLVSAIRVAKQLHRDFRRTQRLSTTKMDGGIDDT